MSTKNQTNNDNIIKLTDYQHHRLRTEMYLGSRVLHTQQIIVYDEQGLPVLKEMFWVPALYTAVREIIDNSLDEVIGHNRGDRIDITYDTANGIVSIRDNGGGIPIDYDSEHKMHKATLAVTESRAGRNFNERGEVIGVNGLGMSVVVSCSQWFRIEIFRDGKKFTQAFEEGDAFHPELQIHKPKIKDGVSKKTGTHIEFKLSREVFSDLTLPDEFMRSRVYEIALCNPGLKIYYNNEQFKTKPQHEKNLFGSKPILLSINEPDFKSKFFLFPEFAAEGEWVHSLVNNVPAFNGGIHVETFRRLFYSGLLEALDRESRKRKLVPNRGDINEGLLIYNITNMKAPSFDSQSKTRLINESVGAILKKHFEDVELYKNIIRKNSDWVDKIFERCAARTSKKDIAELAKLSRSVARSKVPKLIDATGFDRSKAILYLAEGDSAIVGMSAVRDPEIHGGLPLRGKVMNVHGESPKKVLDNQALIDIMNSIGLKIGERINRYTLRYGKIYLAADMDPDGANICALLVNFFYHYWPEMFDKTKDPLVYIFQTPFIVLEKDKQVKYFYAHDYDQFDPKDWHGWKIRRAKGLGTLRKADWKYAIEHPVALGLLDDGKLKETLDLIFNPVRADDRKKWISL